MLRTLSPVWLVGAALMAWLGGKRVDDFCEEEDEEEERREQAELFRQKLRNAKLEREAKAGAK